MEVIKPDDIDISYELAESNIYFQSALDLFNSLVANQSFHYTSSLDVKIINITKYHWSASIIRKIVKLYREAGWNVSIDGGYCADGPFDAIKLSKKPGFISGNRLYKDEAEWRIEYESRLSRRVPNASEVKEPNLVDLLLSWNPFR